MGRNLTQRPVGQTSRVRVADGPRSEWVAENGQVIHLPLIVDHVNIDPESRECVWLIEARVDLVSGRPGLVDIRLTGTPCLDAVRLQRFFRWSTPIDIVCRTIPALQEKGIDPYTHEYAIDGYPDAAEVDARFNLIYTDSISGDNSILNTIAWSQTAQLKFRYSGPTSMVSRGRPWRWT